MSSAEFVPIYHKLFELLPHTESAAGRSVVDGCSTGVTMTGVCFQRIAATAAQNTVYRHKCGVWPRSLHRAFVSDLPQPATE